MCPWNLLNTSELYSSPHGIECALQQPYFRCGRISKMKKILIVYHDAGGGHRNAAVALETVIAQQPRDWRGGLVQVPDVTPNGRGQALNPLTATPLISAFSFKKKRLSSRVC